MTQSTDHSGADLGLFSGREQTWNFSHMKDLFSTRHVPAAPKPSQMPNSASFDLPESYWFSGQELATRDLLRETHTFALLVLKEGTLVHETYATAEGAETHWISWSVAKSVVSALVGIALGDGFIKSLDEPVSAYVTGLKNSAYGDVSIRNVLQMSSGIAWNEDYSDPEAQIHDLIRAMSGKGTFNELLRTPDRAFEPGTMWRYCSADTQALGSLIQHATGQSLSAYFAEKLAHPLGFEASSHWITDREGTEMACGGLLMVPRDYARFGELCRNHGRFGDIEIIPEAYLREATLPATAHTRPGAQPSEGMSIPIGYGLHWWLPWADRTQFAAIGIYNQYILVEPQCQTVIVKLSANPRYGTTSDDQSSRSSETLTFLRALSEAAS